MHTEADIRDYLACNLALIEPGLTLVGKEAYLPNDQGASGFIDIFARSASGQLVIIEIKKSDTTVRQAIHELSKYAALLKSNQLLKETEYRLIVLSTTWHDLLVPFSEFTHATRYDCEGREIVLGINGIPVKIVPVAPLPRPTTRRLSRRHFIWEFEDEKSAKRALTNIPSYMRAVGITDFILLLLTLKDTEYGISHLVYFAQQEQTLERYLDLIRRRFSEIDVADFMDSIADLDEIDDKVSEAADKVWEDIDGSLHNLIMPRGVQISYPEKARLWLVPEKATQIDVIRHGRFVDAHLSDQAIIDELGGAQGESFFFVDMKASMTSKPEADALTRASDNVFFFNPLWRLSTRDLLAYAQGTGANSVHLKGFNNDDILTGIAALALGELRFLPSFVFDIRRGNDVERFVGSVEWDGRVPNFDQISLTHFTGDDFSFFITRHLGANRAMNADLMAELGLTYTLWRHYQGRAAKVRIHGNSIVDARGAQGQPLSEFMKSCTKFLTRLVRLFIDHDSSFAVLAERTLFVEAEAALDKHGGNSTRQRKNPARYWLGDLDRCDMCGRPFTDAQFMVDAKVKHGRGWGNLCALCFQDHGVGLGIGLGQLYRKTKNGWLLVAGGDSPSED